MAVRSPKYYYLVIHDTHKLLVWGSEVVPDPGLIYSKLRKVLALGLFAGLFGFVRLLPASTLPRTKKINKTVRDRIHFVVSFFICWEGFIGGDVHRTRWALETRGNTRKPFDWGLRVRRLNSCRAALRCGSEKKTKKKNLLLPHSHTSPARHTHAHAHTLSHDSTWHAHTQSCS